MTVLLIARLPKMTRSVCLSFWVALLLISPTLALAGPTEDANAVVDRWSAAYTSNDPEQVVKIYWPDAILLGTVSPVLSQGTDAIRKYFQSIKGSGNKNTIDERHAIVVDDNAVVVTGFYTFIRMKDGQPTPSPSRFTMLVTKRGGEWRIAHHHSSPQVQPQQTSLVGTWILVSVDRINADGNRTHFFGPNPAGIAMFDAAGRYSIQVQATGTPKFVSNNRLTGTPEENQAFVQGSNPHWGRYSVNDTDHTITFQIEHAAFPNWNGTQQIRPFTLIGDVLKYIVPETSGGGASETVWQRAK